MFPHVKKYSSFTTSYKVISAILCILAVVYQDFKFKNKKSFSFNVETKNELLIRPSKCLTQIDEDAVIPKNRVCYDRFQHTEYLPCFFNIEPHDETNYVFVCGTSNPIARIFVQMLKDKGIKYREITSKLQYDLQQPHHEFFLKMIRVTHIFDFTRPHNYSLLRNLTRNTNIHVYHMVSKPIGDPKVHEIVIPQVIGPYFVHRSPPALYKRLVNIFDNKKENVKLNEAEMFGSASQIAEYLFNTVYMAKKPELLRFNQKFSTYTAKSIIDLALGHPGEPNEFIKRDFTYIKALKTQPDIPYASLSIVVTDHKNITDRLQKILNLYEKVLPKYPELSLEIIYIYVKTTEKARDLEDIVKFGPQIKKYMKIYTVPYNEYVKVLPFMNTTIIPDYFFRNFGFRISRGEFIFSGSCDFLPPPYFFDAASRKFLLTHQILLPTRVDYNNSSEDEFIVSQYDKFLPIQSLEILGADWEDAWSYSTWMLKKWGDLQGSHRSLVEKLRGYVNDKYTFHVDSIFAIDQTSFMYVPMIYVLPNGIHVYHEQVSQFTNVFPLYESPKYIDAFCQGKSTLYFQEHQRPNWGLGYESRTGSFMLSVQSNNEVHVVIKKRY